MRGKSERVETASTRGHTRIARLVMMAVTALAVMATGFGPSVSPAYGATQTGDSVVSAKQTFDMLVPQLEDQTNTILVEFNVEQAEDKLSMTLPNGFVGDKNFARQVNSIPNSTKTFYDKTGKTIEYSDTNATQIYGADVVFNAPGKNSVEFTLTPHANLTETSESKINNIRWMQPGIHTITVNEVLKASPEVKHSADLSFTIKTGEGTYSTGAAPCPITVNGSNHIGNFARNMSTFFSLDPLKVTYANDSLIHVPWSMGGSTLTLDIPGKFVLSNSSRWTQDPQTGLYVGSGNFSGKFTDTVGLHSATRATGTVSGYFGYADKPTTLTCDTGFTVTITQPAHRLDVRALSSEGTTDNSALIPPTSGSAPAGSQYTEYFNLRTATGSEDVTKFVATYDVPDGSTVKDGSLDVDVPQQGATVTVEYRFNDGTRKEVINHVITADEAGKTSLTLPFATNTDTSNPVTSIVISSTSTLPAGQEVELHLVNTALPTYRNGSALQSGDSRTSSFSAIFSTEAYGDNQVSTPASASTKVTYSGQRIFEDFLVALDSMSTGGALDTGNRSLTYNTQLTDDKDHYYSVQNFVTNSGNTTGTIKEPVFSLLLPMGTQYTGFTLKETTVQPKQSIERLNNGQTLVTLDWTGTGYVMPVDPSMDRKTYFTVNFRTLAYGVDITRPVGAWVSTVNDSTVLVKGNPNKLLTGWKTTQFDAGVEEEVIAGDPFASRISATNITITGAKVLQSYSRITDNKGIESTSAINHLTNPVAKSADHSMSVHLVDTLPVTGTPLLIAVTNLPKGLNAEGKPVSVQIKDASATVVKSTGQVATQAEVYLKYSTEEWAHSDVAGASEMTINAKINQYQFANEVSDWSKIKSFILVIPHLMQEGGQGVEFVANVPLTDSKATSDVRTWMDIPTRTVAPDDGGTPAIAKPQDSSVKTSYVDMHGVKHWDDTNDASGSRPESVTIDLVKPDGTTQASTTANANGEWAFDFDKASIPVVDANNKFINYTVKETAVPGYAAEYGIVGETSHLFDITNTSEGTLVTRLPLTSGAGENPFIISGIVAFGIMVAGASLYFGYRKLHSTTVERGNHVKN